ncbi:patatin-like phospholipase family protein [bacterium]|nr:patatin-like phospholipase family protein [bacterium]
MSSKTEKFPARVGLALGSGAARGWAHLGVIQALVEAGIRVDYIAGTSIGSLVGAFFSAGKLDMLRELILELDWKKFTSLIDVVFPKSGIIEGKKIAHIMRKHVPKTRIEDFTLQFSAVCTDLFTGREIIIQHGDVIEAIRASISIPGIFTPVPKDKTFLVDGGLVNPVPVSVVRNMGASFVIAVDINHDVVQHKIIDHASRRTRSPRTKASPVFTSPRAIHRILEAWNTNKWGPPPKVLPQIRKWLRRDPVPNIFEALITSFNIMESQITDTNLRLNPPDLLLRPRLDDIRFMEFHRGRESISRGYTEAKKQIKIWQEKHPNTNIQIPANPPKKGRHRKTN